MTHDTQQTAAIAIDQVEKTFGTQPVLHGVSLAIMEGELTAILGASGSGKTTLLRLIAGLERADSGTIAIDGNTVDDPHRFTPPERRRVGYVPQEGALFPHLNVAANIGFGLGHGARRTTKESRQRIRELIELVGLDGLEKRQPHQLSGGERQRVALARALAPTPDVVLLDEPFSSLDAELRTAVRREVVDILRRAATTAILVTHDQDEALAIADRIALLQHGAIVQHDKPGTLYNQPANPTVARFIGHSNLLPARYENGAAHCALGTIPTTLNPEPPEGSQITILIRPEQLSLALATENHSREGTVVSREFHGHDVLLSIQLTNPTEHELPRPDKILARLTDTAAPEPGQHVSLQINGKALAWPTDVQAPDKT